ncbi:unnamed protein product, partial [Ascophyllum nodosum]
MWKNAEWRLFLPNKGDGDNLSEAEQTLVTLVDGVRPRDRTDVYTKAGDDIGIKRRSSESLELKALHERRALCKGAGPGTVEIFEKTILARSATLADIVRRCGSGHGGKVSSELEAALRDPVEVHVAKTVRKKALDAGRALVSFEVTDLVLSFATQPANFPQRWRTFCVEGGVEEVE